MLKKGKKGHKGALRNLYCEKAGAYHVIQLVRPTHEGVPDRIILLLRFRSCLSGSQTYNGDLFDSCFAPFLYKRWIRTSEALFMLNLLDLSLIMSRKKWLSGRGGIVRASTQFTRRGSKKATPRTTKYMGPCNRVIPQSALRR